jgi:hypothetical protein
LHGVEIRTRTCELPSLLSTEGAWRAAEVGLSYRKFLDGEGTLWQVWDVRPDEAERRMRERRIRHEPQGADRRGIMDQRGNLAVRTDLPPELRGGWLVFQSPNSKRRYWPIPDQWDQLSVGEMRMLCELAHVVARPDTGALLEQQDPGGPRTVT